MIVGVFGASGFVGRAIERELLNVGHRVRRFRAPRIVMDVNASPIAQVTCSAKSVDADLAGCDVVINAAGIAAATAPGDPSLYGANALLPRVLAEAALEKGVSRFIHVSSAAVQGRANVLDETMSHNPDSPYSESKARGESLLLELSSPAIAIYRPTSVHGPGRPVTLALLKLARSPFAATAAPGDRPTPQIHVERMAQAVAYLSRLDVDVPAVTLHPWEGLTCAQLLRTLGGRSPRLLPSAFATTTVSLAYAASQILGGKFWGHARRLEMLFMGQAQVDGWLRAALPELSTPHPSWPQLRTAPLSGEKPSS